MPQSKYFYNENFTKIKNEMVSITKLKRFSLSPSEPSKFREDIQYFIIFCGLKFGVLLSFPY